MDETLRTELVALLNEALRLEHSAAIQYSSHAEQITGLYSEPIISRLKDSATDEVRHQGVLRGLIGDYLFGVPALNMSEAKPGGSTVEILHSNLDSENEVIALYGKIHQRILSEKENLSGVFETLEHEVRHILMEEQEHVAELNRLVR